VRLGYARFQQNTIDKFLSIRNEQIKTANMDNVESPTRKWLFSHHYSSLHRLKTVALSLIII